MSALVFWKGIGIIFSPPLQRNRNTVKGDIKCQKLKVNKIKRSQWKAGILCCPEWRSLQFQVIHKQTLLGKCSAMGKGREILTFYEREVCMQLIW